MPAQHLSVPKDKLNTWREAIGRQVLKMDFEPSGEAPFRAIIEPLLPEIRLQRLSISPGFTFRDKALTQGDPDTFAILIASQVGLDLSQRGTDLRLGRGEATLLRTSQPGAAGLARAHSYLSLVVPIEVIADRVALFDRCVMRPFPRTSPALRLIKGYIRCIEACAGSNDPALRVLLCRHMLELTDLFVMAADGPSPSERSDAVRAARVASIRGYIERHSADPALSVEAVAAAEGISERYLQRLLEQTGTSFTESVAQRRLAHARTMLTDPEHARRHVLDIALLAGFSDVSYFNRLFRRRYGMTPGEARAGQ